MWDYKKKAIDDKRLKRKGRTLYHSKTYSNPYFTINKRKKFKLNLLNFSFKIKLFLVLFVLLMLAGAWFTFYSHFFEIKYIQASGGQRVDSREVENIAWQQIEQNFLIFIRQKNIFLFDNTKLSDILNLKFGFEQLTINKKLPDTLIIKYKEKNYVLIWQENENYFFIDTRGDIIAQATTEEASQKLYPLVINTSEVKINNNRVGVAQLYLDYINGLIKIFKEQPNDIKIKNYSLDNESFTIKVITENGPTILFSTEENIDKQMQKLLIIKNQKLKNDFLKKKYIDIRYGDRVYYR